MPEDSTVKTVVTQRFSDPTRYKANEARVVEVKPFLWGKIYQLRFPRVNGSEKTVHVWEPEPTTTTGDVTEGLLIFEDEEEIVSFVSLYQPRIIAKAGALARHNLISKFGPVELVSGAIAILLTGAMVFILIHQSVSKQSLEVPAILANILTTIVGFYFGKATTNSSPSPPTS